MTPRARSLLRNLPALLTPPLVGLLRNRWRDRNRAMPNIPDHQLYKPIFSPWLGNGSFGAMRDRVSEFSLVSPDRLWILHGFAENARNLAGDFVECGVFKGGTARLLAEVLSTDAAAMAGERRLMLFDTFGGMPDTDSAVDKHRPGDFSDTTLERVRRNVGDWTFAEFHAGFIPDSFTDARFDGIALLHVDLDIRKSILDTLEECFDRVVGGGFILFDDYGFESCYGARLAVDAFFKGRPEMPICLPTGQALVVKRHAEEG